MMLNEDQKGCDARKLT